MHWSSASVLHTRLDRAVDRVGGDRYGNTATTSCNKTAMKPVELYYVLCIQYSEQAYRRNTTVVVLDSQMFLYALTVPAKRFHVDLAVVLLGLD